MLRKRIKLFWKSGLTIVISLLLLPAVSGCNDTSSKEGQVEKNTAEIQNTADNSENETEKITGICLDLYEKATQKNKISDLETIRSIINRFGENGYAAIDNQNQIDMTHAEQVVKFCEKVDAQEEAEITIIEVDYLGGFVKYDLQTKEGNVNVDRSYYEYNNGTIQGNFVGSYQAEEWNYTEEHTALRVEPLNATCRSLTQNYLLPISFERNNMFIVDWSEDDFGETWHTPRLTAEEWEEL